MLYLTEELMADVEWWRLCLTEGLAGRELELSAPFFGVVTQPYRRARVSDTSFEVVRGQYMEAGSFVWTQENKVTDEAMFIVSDMWNEACLSRNQDPSGL